MTLTCVFWDAAKGKAPPLGKTGGRVWTPLGVQGSARPAPPLPALLFVPLPCSLVPSLPSPLPPLPSDPPPPSPGPTGDWSSTGCSTEAGAQATVCRCDHLTFFALLLVTAPRPQPSTSRGAQPPVLGGAVVFGGGRAWPPLMGSWLGVLPTEAGPEQGRRAGPHANLPGGLRRLHGVPGLHHRLLRGPEVGDPSPPAPVRKINIVA